MKTKSRPTLFGKWIAF